MSSLSGVHDRLSQTCAIDCHFDLSLDGLVRSLVPPRVPVPGLCLLCRLRLLEAPASCRQRQVPSVRVHLALSTAGLEWRARTTFHLEGFVASAGAHGPSGRKGRRLPALPWCRGTRSRVGGRHRTQEDERRKPQLGLTYMTPPVGREANASSNLQGKREISWGTAPRRLDC